MSGRRKVPECLEKIIREEIERGGAMPVPRFMELALSHPEHGYYMTKDPFGVDGDFITAPEVSQLFGEMIGVWIADLWMQMGKPERFILLECGPGRGTLMADILRATRNVSGFHAAVDLHLLEVSPVLKARQEKALAAHRPRWHEGLESVPDDAPMIVLGNEFLDALPFHSLQKTGEGWKERYVTYEGGAFAFTLVPAAEALIEKIPFHIKGASAGSVFEISPAREAFAAQVAQRVKAQSGAALFIDYGHDRSGVGDTFQGLKGNRYSDVLADVGEADLTSHVDFEALMAAVGDGVGVHGTVTQGAFLKALGIEMRADMLLTQNGAQFEGAIKKGLHRLCASSEMGTLFKVLGLTAHHESITPAGF